MKPLTQATARLLKPLEGLADNDRMYLELTNDAKKFKAKLYRKRGDDLWYPSGRLSGFMQRFPEKQRLTSGGEGETWLLGATDHTVEIIESAFPKPHLLMDDEARTAFQYLMLNRMRQGLVAERTANFKTKKVVPEIEGGFELHATYPLAPYQVTAAVNSMDAEGYALFMEQGTGKTATVLARIMNECHRKKRERLADIYKVLIVCPRQVRLNWQNEVIKFATRKGRVTRIRGNKLARMRCVIDALDVEEDDEFCVMICNYESVAATQDALKAVPEWDLVVLDESHMIKNPGTQRFRSMKELRERSRQRMVLTGTPITNTPFDLFSQWEFLGEGWSGFTSFEAFKKFFGVYDKQGCGDGIGALAAFQNMPFMQERLAKQAFVIKKSEALAYLPKKLHDVVSVDMSPKQIDAYRQLLTTLRVEVENAMGRAETAIAVNNVLTKMLRLSQITSGFLVHEAVYSDDGEVIRPRSIDRFDPNPKLDELVTQIKAMPKNSKALVWSCYTQDIKSIRARLTMEGIDCVTFYGQTKDAKRDEAVERFNSDPKCRVFIGNPVAGGAGLNLLGYVPERADEYETNCDHVFYYSQNWSMTARAQSEDRAHRRGTRVPVRYATLCCENTIDEVVHERVMGKIELANSVTELRKVLDGVFKTFDL